MMNEGPEKGGPGLIRISKIVGSYLVFDAGDVVRLRREHRLPSALTGTLPQSPQQNAFLGLPLQISTEEARLLVEEGVACIVDERAAGLGLRSALSPRAEGRGPNEARRDERGADGAAGTVTVGTGDGSPTDPPARAAGLPQGEGLKALPLYTFFHKAGYYMTPGLRFGCDFSVYPGDPFRFHSHFLARNVGWDEPISILDITGSGRLATGVKKGFVFGGQVPQEDSVDGAPTVRAITLEWAGM